MVSTRKEDDAPSTGVRTCTCKTIGEAYAYAYAHTCKRGNQAAQERPRLSRPSRSARSRPEGLRGKRVRTCTCKEAPVEPNWGERTYTRKLETSLFSLGR